MNTKTERIEVDRDLLEQLLANYETVRKSLIMESESSNLDHARAKLDKEIKTWRERFTLDVDGVLPWCRVCDEEITDPSQILVNGKREPRHSFCCPSSEDHQHVVDPSTVLFSDQENIADFTCAKCHQSGSMSVSFSKENVQW